MTDDLVQSAHGAMDVTVELGIAAKVHDDMTGKPNTMAGSIRRGIAEIERLRAEIAELRARIADAPTVCADTDNIVEIANSLGYYHCTRVAPVVVND